MVLADLGSKITGAIRRMSNTTMIDEAVLDDMLKEITRALLSADVNVRTVAALKKNVKAKVNIDELAAGVNRRRIIEKAVFDELCGMLDPGKKPYSLKKGKSNVVMFVGLQGNGKTTSCVKYAYHYQRKGWKTCVVCADTFRAGAFDQLKQNCTKAKIPFYGSYEQTDPVKIAQEGVDHFRSERYELIIVDTSGRHKQEDALFDEMKQMELAVTPNDITFVMDSSIGQAAFDQAEAFRNKVDVGSVIITKLDGHAKGGGALSAVSATKSPITFIGVGEHIDEFEEFSTESFVGRLLGKGDVSGLVNSIKEAGLADNPELVQRLSAGVFTLRDLYDQFKNISKLGPLSKVMSMMPGLGDGLMPPGREREGQAKINMFLTMMDSMTAEELDNPKPQFCDSRLIRIARGSGRSVRDVHDLVEEYKKFSKVVLKMGKMKGLKGNTMNKNIPAELAQAIDPRVLNRMGGLNGMTSMLKELSAQFPNGKLPM